MGTTDKKTDPIRVFSLDHVGKEASRKTGGFVLSRLFILPHHADAAKNIGNDQVNVQGRWLVFLHRKLRQGCWKSCFVFHGSGSSSDA
jgi:hypothetical protein